MSVVVRLGDYKNKGTLMILRGLLFRALRGEVTGLAFNVEFKDGTRKTGFTGKYRADAAEARLAVSSMNSLLSEAQEPRQLSN